MATQDPTTRPVQDSLVSAARHLESTIALPLNEGALHEALREAIVSVEFHLDTLRAAGGMEEQFATAQPRLLPELMKLDSTLAQVLMNLWAAQKQGGVLDAAMLERLAAASVEMRQAAERETALLHEGQVALGGQE